MAISKYQHVLDAWVFPRVYHFLRRFLDVHKRFTNVISHGPHSFILKPKSEVVDKILHLKGMLEHPIEIYVIGKNNIVRDDMVITSEDPHQTEHKKKSSTMEKVAKEKPKGQGLTLVLLHIDIKDTGENGMKDVRKTVQEFTSKHRKKIPVSDESIIIVCEQKAIYNQAQLDEFRHMIATDLRKSSGLHLPESLIIFPKHKEVVSTKVSQVLESQVIEGFLLMKAHLESFVRSISNYAMENVDIVETDTLVSALQGFLKNGMGFVDILADSKSKGVSFEELLLSNLVRVIRCAVLDPISLKFDLTPDTCNQVAFDINLDGSMKEKISKNTRYHLRKIESPSCDLAEAIKKGDKWYTFPSRNFMFIAYPLRDDIRSAVLDFEKALATLRRNVLVMKKMIYELDGNIKLSQLYVEDVSFPKSKKGCSPELKKSLFQLEGVYGMGRIFGEWEVHVEDDKAEQSVKDMMADYGIRYPVRIRQVLTKAKSLAGNQVEHGISLLARLQDNPDRYKSGTLGMFADGTNGDLYALTCGHVVNVAGEIDHEVFVTDGTGERKMLGTSSSSRTVKPGQLRASLIDFAAVKVCNEFIPNCTKYLKDDDGMLKNAKMSTESTRNLSSLYIFKYGAASHLTSGIVCSVDYSFGDTTDEYVILIAPPPDVNTVDYARPGDSGSVNCMRDINNNRAVMAVSMLNGGNFTLTGHEETFITSFKLTKGFEGLENMPSGVRLSVPSEYSGGPMF